PRIGPGERLERDGGRARVVSSGERRDRLGVALQSIAEHQPGAHLRVGHRQGVAALAPELGLGEVELRQPLPVAGALRLTLPRKEEPEVSGRLARRLRLGLDRRGRVAGPTERAGLTEAARAAQSRRRPASACASAADVSYSATRPSSARSRSPDRPASSASRSISTRTCSQSLRAPAIATPNASHKSASSASAPRPV